MPPLYGEGVAGLEDGEGSRFGCGGRRGWRWRWPSLPAAEALPPPTSAGHLATLPPRRSPASAPRLAASSSPSPSRRPPASPSRPLAAGEPAAWSRPPAAVPAVRYVVSGPGVLGSRRVLDSLDWTGDAALRSTSPHPPPASSSSSRAHHR
ncbi:hypothetical protein DAI22_02g053850 [Oryza sativa Japonica Group]|nr:hypothetical protein DAI22_02g053850 [Oryza sativa Japonica Group]